MSRTYNPVIVVQYHSGLEFSFLAISFKGYAKKEKGKLEHII